MAYTTGAFERLIPARDFRMSAKHVLSELVAQFFCGDPVLMKDAEQRLLAQCNAPGIAFGLAGLHGGACGTVVQASARLAVI